MKTLKTLFTVAIASIFLISCSKDEEEKEEPLQNPLAGYLAASGFDQKTTNLKNNGDYEFGISFIPTVNGKITAIVAKIPDVRNGLRVTIWDKTTSTVLRTETIDITTANVEVTKQISTLNLVKDKEYFITFNSNDWYSRTKTDDTAATYPFVVGDITITSYAFVPGTAQTIPNTPVKTYYAGDCSFIFQKTK